MSKLLTKLKEKSLIETISLGVTVLLSAVSISSVALAYGPDRATFTQANPASYVTFDSITDDPTYGDERDFFRVRDVTSGESSNTTYTDSANLVAGNTYEALVFFHNNAASNLDASGVGIAKNVSTRVDMPAVVKSGATDTEANAYINSSNANPQQVYDDIAFNNPSKIDMALREVPGSVTFNDEGSLSGSILSDSSLFSSTGQPLGFDSLNGTLPGCDHYSGYITFKFTAEQPNFNFTKDVRVAGTKDWTNNLTVPNGAKLEYRLGYDNTGQVQQDDVTMEDSMPAGLGYTAGSTELDNSKVTGEKLGDGIETGKVDIGSYAAGANAYLYYDATVNAAPCSVLTNTATLLTQNGNSNATATVTVAGNCTAALPHTGPAQIVAGLIGLGAITFGVVYYIRSRRELGAVLLSTQSSPEFSSTNRPPAPDTEHAVDGEAKHVHKKSEHNK